MSTDDDDLDEIEWPTDAIPPPGDSPVFATISVTEIAEVYHIPNHLLNSLSDPQKDNDHA